MSALASNPDVRMPSYFDCTLPIPSVVVRSHPTWIHESTTPWITKNVVKAIEEALPGSSPGGGGAVRQKLIVAGNIIYKEPDNAIVFRRNHKGKPIPPFPSCVVEIGWTESYHDLVRDASLWLTGSGGKVLSVILINIASSKPQSILMENWSAVVEVWVRNVYVDCF